MSQDEGSQLKVDGAKIKRLRLAADISQGKLARAASIDPAYISMIETGKRQWAGPAILTAIALALHTTPGDLLSESPISTNRDEDDSTNSQDAIDEIARLLLQYEELRPIFADYLAELGPIADYSPEIARNEMRMAVERFKAIRHAMRTKPARKQRATPQKRAAAE
jgi:transcriptional regulator with XRE-family HTH domain